jgi:hypothetical protein
MAAEPFSGVDIKGRALTVADVADWLSELPQTGARQLGDARRYGIGLVTAEAQRLLTCALALRTTAAGPALSTWAVDGPPVGSGELLDATGAMASATSPQEMQQAYLRIPSTAFDESLPRHVLYRARLDLLTAEDQLHAMLVEPRSKTPRPEAILDGIRLLYGQVLAAEANATTPAAPAFRGLAGGGLPSSGMAPGGSDLERRSRAVLASVLGATVPTDPTVLLGAMRRRFGQPSAQGLPALSSTPVAPGQAVLVADAGATAGSAARRVAGLDSPSHLGADRFDESRAAVMAELTGLAEEFGRDDGPRGDRVELLLRRLRGGRPNVIGGDLHALREAGSSHLDRGSVSGESFELQLDLIERQVANIHVAWTAYKDQSSITVQVARLEILLTVLADSTRAWVRAMDGAGISASERRLVRIDRWSAQLARVVDEEAGAGRELDDVILALEHIHDERSSIAA